MEYVVLNTIVVESVNDLKMVKQFMDNNKLNMSDINISQLAREANCSRATVRNHLNGNLKGYPKNKKSKVDKVNYIIEEVLNDPLIKTRTMSSLYDYIKRENPELVDFTMGTFRYHIRKYYKNKFDNKCASSYTTRFETEPGVQCQFDFKENFKVVYKSGESENVDIGVIQWSNSRHVYRRVIRDKTTSSVVEFLAEAFEYYGGIPQQLVVDNAKSIITSHNAKSGEVVVNPLFENFIKDYGIDLYACKPYRAQTKGKVERTMTQVDDLNLYLGKLTDIYEFSDKLDLLTSEFNTRISSATGMVPEFVLRIEKEHMKPLINDNIRSMYIPKFVHCSSDKSGMIKYKNKFYSIPYQLSSKQFKRLIAQNKIHFYYNKKFITSHEISDNLLNIKNEHVHESVKLKKENIINFETSVDEMSIHATNSIQSLEGRY